MNKDVLIVGAGPTGLVLALWLIRQGVSVRIIDKDKGPGETSRAMAVQARTLELYRQLDLAEKTVEAGYKNPGINLWVGCQRKAHVSFNDVGANLTPYPFLLLYPQDRHEKLLIKQLAQLGVFVERETELIGFENKDTHVTARLRLPNQSEACCDTYYLAGCDGARSFVRQGIGAGFEGGTYKHVFYVADVEVLGIEPKNEVNVAIDSSDFVAILPYDSEGKSRLIGTVQDARAERAQMLTFNDVAHEAIDKLGLHVQTINWFSTYHVHHRVTDHFICKRVFLLGDAAHVHSPVGGQGMNTGIADAINLAWKLAAVLQGKSSEKLLDSYAIERSAFARRLVDTTDRLFTFISADGKLAYFVRRFIAPTAANLVSKIKPIREYLFRAVSQTMLNYRTSPLSFGKAGKIRGGDRLPWVVTALADNYESLRAICWQIHVYGEEPAEIRGWCQHHGIVFHVFTWDRKYKKAGFLEGAVYVLRPDTYVAFADANPIPASLDSYFNVIGWVNKYKNEP